MDPKRKRKLEDKKTKTSKYVSGKQTTSGVNVSEEGCDIKNEESAITFECDSKNTTDEPKNDLPLHVYNTRYRGYRVDKCDNKVHRTEGHDPNTDRYSTEGNRKNADENKTDSKTKITLAYHKRSGRYRADNQGENSVGVNDCGAGAKTRYIATYRKGNDSELAESDRKERSVNRVPFYNTRSRGYIGNKGEDNSTELGLNNGQDNLQHTRSNKHGNNLDRQREESKTNRLTKCGTMRLKRICCTEEDGGKSADVNAARSQDTNIGLGTSNRVKIECHRKKQTRFGLEDTEEGIEKSQFPVFTPSSNFIGRISLKCPEDTDKTGSWIWGLVVTSGGKLIVSDHANMAIKLVDTKRDRIIHRLGTTAHPRDVTIVNENKAAVTIPDELKIMFIKVNDASLISDGDIETVEKYYGIIFHDNILIVSCIAPRGIHTLNMSGGVLRAFEVFDIFQQSVITYPTFITLSLDKQSVYMTDTKHASITHLSLDGRTLNELAHKDIRGVTGVAVDKEGNVYVGSWASEKGYVTKLNSDLTNPRVFLGENDHVNLPCPIYIDHETDILYLSNSLHPNNEFVSLYYM